MHARVFLSMCMYAATVVASQVECIQNVVESLYYQSVNACLVMCAWCLRYTCTSPLDRGRYYAIPFEWLSIHHSVSTSGEALFPFHYENAPVQIYRKLHRQKTENFQIKNCDIFHISAQNIDSNEYTQSMFWAEIRKKMYTPVNPSFTI